MSLLFSLPPADFYTNPRIGASHLIAANFIQNFDLTAPKVMQSAAGDTAIAPPFAYPEAASTWDLPNPYSAGAVHS